MNPLNDFWPFFKTSVNFNLPIKTYNKLNNSPTNNKPKLKKVSFFRCVLVGWFVSTKIWRFKAAKRHFFLRRDGRGHGRAAGAFVQARRVGLLPLGLWQKWLGVDQILMEKFISLTGPTWRLHIPDFCAYMDILTSCISNQWCEWTEWTEWNPYNSNERYPGLKSWVCSICWISLLITAKLSRGPTCRQEPPRNCPTKPVVSLSNIQHTVPLRFRHMSRLADVHEKPSVFLFPQIIQKFHILDMSHMFFPTKNGRPFPPTSNPSEHPHLWLRGTGFQLRTAPGFAALLLRLLFLEDCWLKLKFVRLPKQFQTQQRNQETRTGSKIPIF